MATPRQESKVKRVMGEFKAGQLRSSSGQKVRKRKQAIAIALSESGQARKPAAGRRRRRDTTGNDQRKKSASR